VSLFGLRAISKGVAPALLQEARAKLARQQVKSERPGLPAGAFAFGGVRTPFCDRGLRVRRSRGVGQRRDAHGTIRPSLGRPGRRSQEGLRDFLGLEVSVYEVGRGGYGGGYDRKSPGCGVGRRALAVTRQGGHRTQRGMLELGAPSPKSEAF